MLERLAIGIVTGIFGFFTGVLSWWLLSDVPGFRFGWLAYLIASCALGTVSLLLSLWRPHETVDALGAAGRWIWSFWKQVLSWFQFLR